MPDYEDTIEVPIAHKVLCLSHEWRFFAKEIEKGFKTTPVKCILCDAEASAIFYCPRGCTCSPNKIQPRCEHHIMRANDTKEEMYLLEDFRIGE